MSLSQLNYYNVAYFSVDFLNVTLQRRVCFFYIHSWLNQVFPIIFHPLFIVILHTVILSETLLL